MLQKCKSKPVGDSGIAPTIKRASISMLALFCDDGGPGPVPYRCRECIYAFHGTDKSVPYGASCDGAAGRETRPLRGGASRAQCRLVMVLNHVKGLSPRARSRGLRTELTHAVNEMRRSLHALRLVGMTGFLNLMTLVEGAAPYNY